MEIVEILSRLDRLTGSFPRAAVDAAVARREEIVPDLLRILELTIEYAHQLESESDYMAHLYAMFLLAQFRENRAYPLLLRFAALPGRVLDALCGDFITENLGNVLASVCGGDTAGIRALIENEDADEWARGAALGALVTLVSTGQIDREPVVNYLGDLFRGKIAREPSSVWDALVSFSCDLYPEELLADIEQAYQEKLVDPRVIGMDDIKADLAIGKEAALARLRNNTHRRLIHDTVAEMRGWRCFKPLPVKQIKTGRNEPCPCGSGKKYKKCCGFN